MNAACHCTIVPPHMTEHMNQNIENPEAKERAEAIYAKHARLRGKRTQYFAGVKSVEPPKPEGEIVKIFDVRNRKTLPGTFVGKPQSSDDSDVKNAWLWATKTHEFYLKFFDRNSIDGQGMEMISSVHYRKGYNNAFWNGRQMAYGDGDDVVFTSFTEDVDITGHEITHGVTQFDIDLVYEGQSGALNESLSDVFGSMLKQYVEQTNVAEADWLIGDKLMIGDAYALRSMRQPGQAYVDHPYFGNDPQPGSMDAYVQTDSDNGGVHINSGIPNRAFYLACQRLHDLDSQKYAFAWDGAGKVWYEARKKNITPNADFVDFAEATVAAANQIFGAESQEAKQIHYAWGDVKVLQHPVPAPAPQGPRGRGCCRIL